MIIVRHAPLDGRGPEDLPNKYAQLLANDFYKRLREMDRHRYNGTVEVIMEANEDYPTMRIEGDVDEQTRNTLIQIFEELRPKK